MKHGLHSLSVTQSISDCTWKAAGMEKLVAAQTQKAKSATIRPFTAESLEKITQRINAEKQRAAEEEKKLQEAAEAGVAKAPGGRARRPVTAADKKAEAAATRKYPNPALETGKKFPDKLGEFPRELYGKPIEDLDDYYNNKYVSAFIFLRRRHYVIIIQFVRLCVSSVTRKEFRRDFLLGEYEYE